MIQKTGGENNVDQNYNIPIRMGAGLLYRGGPLLSYGGRRT